MFKKILPQLPERILKGNVWVKDKLTGHLEKVREVKEEDGKIVIYLRR